MPKHWKFLIQLGIGLALLIVWLRLIDLDVLRTYLSAVDLRYALLMYLVGFVAGLVRFTRLKIILAPLVKVPILPLYVIGIASAFFNFVLAMRAGELSKGYYLKKFFGTSFARATGAVIVDRAIDFLIIIATVLVIGVLGKRELVSVPMLMIIFLAPLVFLFLLAWEGEKIFGRIAKVARKLPPVFQEKVFPVLERFIQGFSVAKRDPLTLGFVFALSFLALLLDAVGIGFLFRAFGLNVSFLSILLANGLFVLSFLIPSPPGYIGTVEVAGSLIFVLVLGIEKNLAASIALFFHIYSAFFTGIFGIPAVLYLQLKKAGGK